MSEKYSIQEILSAMNDLNKLEKNANNIIVEKPKKIKIDNSEIPSNTLKLIEEAEKSKN